MFRPLCGNKNALKFRVRGEDDSPWGDEYPHDPYFSSQFVSRSVLAGYVDGIKKKEHKFYDLERGPWPVIAPRAPGRGHARPRGGPDI